MRSKVTKSDIPQICRLCFLSALPEDVARVQTVYQRWTERAGTLIGQKSTSLCRADLSAAIGVWSQVRLNQRITVEITDASESQRKRLRPSSTYSLLTDQRLESVSAADARLRDGLLDDLEETCKDGRTWLYRAAR